MKTRIAEQINKHLNHSPATANPTVALIVRNEQKKARYGRSGPFRSTCDPGRVRTYDPLIKSQMLCQLSYGIM